MFSSIVFFQFNFVIVLFCHDCYAVHFVEANFRGISRPLQQSSVWLPHLLISNGFSNTTATTFFILQLLTVYNNYYNNYFNNNDELTRQALSASNQCRTVNKANVISWAIYTRSKRDCALNYLAYFPSTLSRLTKTFSTLILTNYS